MRIPTAFFIVAIFCLLCVVCGAQSPPAGAPTPVAPSEPVPAAPDAPSLVAPAAPLAPSGLLQPSLDTVQQTVTALKLDKWKRGTVRDEAGENVSAILKDLHVNLPPLLTVADAAPETVSKVLPVSRNIDALYAVLLRVNEAARVSAPAEQVTQLDQALNSLRKARLALDDDLQESASAMEKQVSDLQTTLHAQAAVKSSVVPAPATPACVTPTPARKVIKKKPKPPATTPAPASPAPAAATPKAQN